MSPKKFDLGGDYNHQVKSGIVMNGPRPAPLRLKQESHTIHKQKDQQQQKYRKPVIIYIHSPEVIHTKPHDFMALVQKLTGQSKDQEKHQKKTLKQDGYDLNDNYNHNDNDNDNEDDILCDSRVMLEKNIKSARNKSPLFKTPANPYLGDIPLFTPNSSDYFFSPRCFLKFSDMSSSSPNPSSSLSPGSIMEIIKGLPEY